MTDPPADERPDFAHEVAGMVSAVQDWMRHALPESAIGHGGPECQWCPICQFVNLLRGERPDVNERVAEAANALANAAKAFADAATVRAQRPDGAERARPRPTPRVQRIDLDQPGES
jgi:hypothetical protein